MDSPQELKALRIRLGDELDLHEKETQRIRKALEAIDEVERLLSQSAVQTTIPETSPYENMGPSELVLAIVNSSPREWSIGDILKAAQSGGKNMKTWKNARSVLYVAARRHVDDGKIGTTKNSIGNVTYKRIEKSQ